MSKQCIATDAAPGAVGPYSQAVRMGNLVFVSGQLGLDPQTGELVQGGVEAETRRALENLSAIVQAAGGSLANIVKTTVLLADIGDFAKVNAIYATFFKEAPPARAAYQVAALPLGGRVEIEGIATI